MGWVGESLNKGWVRVAIAVTWYLVILAFAPIARVVVDTLRERALLGSSVTAAFGIVGGVAALVVVLLWRRGSVGKASLAIAAVLSVTLLVGGHMLVARMEERLHVIEYACLGVLVFWAWPARRDEGDAREPERRGSKVTVVRLLAAALLAGAAGVAEEGFQALLPTRVCDVGDMLLNVFSAAAGVGVVCGATLPTMISRR